MFVSHYPIPLIILMTIDHAAMINSFIQNPNRKLILPKGVPYQCKILNNALTHWGRVTHICVSKLTIIGSDNGLPPDRRQAIIWTDAGILLIRTTGTNFSEILGEIHSFSFKKMHLKMSSAKGRLFSLGLNELIYIYIYNACSQHLTLDVTMLFEWLIVVNARNEYLQR